MKTSKKIGSFKEFLNEQKKQKQQKINEANLEIQVDFWDTAQNDVIEDLKTQCNGDLNYDNIVFFNFSSVIAFEKEISFNFKTNFNFKSDFNFNVISIVISLLVENCLIVSVVPELCLRKI